eukprot:9234035-Pyramimonas_sp.AAC.1
MHPRASSSAMVFFSKIQDVGYSACMRGRGADASGTFMNASSSARMPIWPSVCTINTVCNMSRSDIALMPLRTLAEPSVLRWLRGRMSLPYGM